MPYIGTTALRYDAAPSYKLCTADFTCSPHPIVKDVYFFTWSPKKSGKQPFSAFLKMFPYFLSLQEEQASFGGGGGIITPGWSMHYIQQEYTIRSGLWAVIFSPFHSTQ